MALIQKAFSDIITFSRSSNATRVGPTGLVEYAPHNLLTYSEQFDNAAWTTTNTTIAANVAAAPNGTVTADALIPDVVNTEHNVGRSYSFTTGVTVAISCYVKASGYTFVQINQGINSSYVNFNIAAGSGAVTLTSGSGISGSVSDVGNGWYRCVVVFTPTSSATQPVRFQNISSGTAERRESFAGDGTSGIYLWGAQLSVGPYPLDYTPTTSAAVYGPRFDFDPVTLAARGLLVEEQRTNLCTYSEQINQWSATNFNVTVTSNSVAAPDGQTTAETVTSDTTNSYHIIGHADVAFTSGSNYTYSIFVKAGTARYVQILFGSAAFPVTEYANFDLQTGTVVGGDTADATISALANGWYRLAYKGTANASFSDRGYLGIITTASAARAEAHTQVLSIYAWGAQLEAGSFATSYIPTLASTVTRSADVASVNTLSPFYNATEGTLFAELSGFLSASYFQAPAYNFGDSNNRIELRAVGNPFTYNRSVVTTSGATQADISSTGLSSSASTSRKVALAYKADDFATVGTGGTTATDTSGTIPTVSVLNIGTAPYDSTVKTNGWIARIAYYPRKLSSAELQALTA